jgi:hypothetical protein
MAKAAKKLTQTDIATPEFPDHENLSIVTGAFDPADDNQDREWPDDITRESPDDANVDHLPEEGDGDSLLSPEQLKGLGDTAEHMRRPLNFMSFNEDTGVYTVNQIDVTGSKATAIVDRMIIQRSLWISGKPVETHGYFLAELKGAKPPRPKTFTNRERWREYHKDHKESDPWNNLQIALPLSTSGGGIISFQSNAATRSAIGNLLADFIKSGGRRRPIIQLTSETNVETGKFFPVLKVVGYAESNEDFGFLREMLIRDDAPFPEPEKPKDDGYWSSGASAS